MAVQRGQTGLLDGQVVRRFQEVPEDSQMTARECQMDGHDGIVRPQARIASALLHEPPDAIQAAGLGRQHEGRRPIRGSQVDPVRGGVRLGGEEPHGPATVALTAAKQGRPPVRVPRPLVRSVGQQEPHNAIVALGGGKVSSIEIDMRSLKLVLPLWKPRGGECSPRSPPCSRWLLSR